MSKPTSSRRKATNARSRTSETDPLRVDWLPTASPGRLGLTIAPGRTGASMSGKPWKRDLVTDLARLADHHGASVLVCLLEDREFETLGIPGLVAQAQSSGLEVVRLPIVDGGAPSKASVVNLVALIRARTAKGSHVVVHCAAGLGRSGLVAASVLIAEGRTAQEAVDTLHEKRSPRSPENSRQEAFLMQFERHYRESTTTAAGSPKRRPSREDGIAGAVLGAALGDALGHPTEFMKLPAIRSRWGPEGVQGFELYWERDGKRFAPYTDDTQMAEVVLRVLVDSKRHGDDLEATMVRMGRGFVEWDRNPQGGHRAPGNACRAGCRALARGVHWSVSGGEDAGGCGSVMRAFPFGLVFADDLERAELWSVEHSKLTHRAPLALASCAAMAVGTALALTGKPPEQVIDTMIDVAARYCASTARMMQQARNEAHSGVAPDVTLTRLQSWAAHEAIAAAVYIFVRHPDDVRAAILEGANTDGDSDSIATLAGALVGARCGIAEVPAEWVRDIERGEQLARLAKDASDLFA